MKKLFSYSATSLSSFSNLSPLTSFILPRWLPLSKKKYFTIFRHNLLSDKHFFSLFSRVYYNSLSISLPISVLLFLKVNSSNWLGDVKFIRFGFVTLGLILAFSIIKKLPLKLPSFNLTNSLKTCFCCYISMTSFCVYWFNGKSTWQFERRYAVGFKPKITWISSMLTFVFRFPTYIVFLPWDWLCYCNFVTIGLVSTWKCLFFFVSFGFCYCFYYCSLSIN